MKPLHLRLLEAADRIAHRLYEPALQGRRCARIRHEWAHDIHLIPGSWLEAVCDRYEAALTGEPRP